MDCVIELRHELHRNPELSGVEVQTAERIARFFEPLRPDMILKNLGGNGVAVVFSGTAPGSTVLLRAELDALPIQEINQLPYGSLHPGIAHKCGHDGHMAILAAVGLELSANRPDRGRVVLLFQPAEETGAGAAAVICDPRFTEIAPDFVFALHNLPGFPAGQTIIRSGSFTSASRGMTVKLFGASAHAAQPETGLSPAIAMAQIIERLSNVPLDIAPVEEIAFATVVGAKLGEKAFGTAPGEAEIWATLRTETDAAMEQIVTYAEKIVNDFADFFNLAVLIEYTDIFSATINSSRASDIVRRSSKKNSMLELERPFRWSEDFGCFTAIAEGALFGIGSGVGIPELHNNHYDFPDEVITPASQIFLQIIEQCLAGSLSDYAGQKGVEIWGKQSDLQSAHG